MSSSGSGTGTIASASTLRVTDADVKEIIETTVTTLPFRTAANLIVTQRLGDSGLSSDLLKEIERWLSAHLIACSKEQQIEKAGAGEGVSVTYQGKSGMQLESTQYGQQVLVLDSTGRMAGLKSASIQAITSFE
jgi:hypothetical protein